jgi:hypothetical protein
MVHPFDAPFLKKCLINEVKKATKFRKAESRRMTGRPSGRKRYSTRAGNIQFQFTVSLSFAKPPFVVCSAMDFSNDDWLHIFIGRVTVSARNC